MKVIVCGAGKVGTSIAKHLVSQNNDVTVIDQSLDLIKKELINIKEDGSFQLNMDYFGYCDDLKMIKNKFEILFNGKARNPESQISKRDTDLAASIQKVIKLLSGS